MGFEYKVILSVPDIPSVPSDPVFMCLRLWIFFLKLSSLLYAVTPGTPLALGLLALWELGPVGNNEESYLYLVFSFFVLIFKTIYSATRLFIFHTCYQEGSGK